MLRKVVGSSTLVLSNLALTAAAKLGFSNQYNESGYIDLRNATAEAINQVTGFLSSKNPCHVTMASVPDVNFIRNICSDGSVQVVVTTLTHGMKDTLKCLISNLQSFACEKSSPGSQDDKWQYWAGAAGLLLVVGCLGVRCLNKSSNQKTIENEVKDIEAAVQNENQYVPPTVPDNKQKNVTQESKASPPAGMDLFADERVVDVMNRWDYPVENALAGSTTNLQPKKPASKSKSPAGAGASVASFSIVHQKEKPGRNLVVGSLRNSYSKF